MTMDKTEKWLPLVIWLAVLALPFFAWLHAQRNPLHLTAYSIFPLLGMLAWTTMWSHYAYGSLRLAFPSLTKNVAYSKTTEIFVLACIVLHPSLLAWQLWRTTGALPPTSFYKYVGSSLKLFVMSGSFALLLFLSYEVLHRLREKPMVIKNWRWISLSQMLAMVVIFVHGLKLGQNLRAGWMQFVWVCMGALLVPAFALVLQHEWKHPET